jgi:Reverse transcriptase (RNA-dependent DNA polymerase)
VGDTWAPTVHAETWRFLLAVGARLDLEMSQMDIAGAFLKEHMPEDMDDMYMRLPVAHTGDPVFVRLLRSLYGLREAPRIFHLGLRKHLLELGFRTSTFDTCLFSKKNADGSTVWAAIHVDDIFVFASSTAARDAFRAGMVARYELSWQDEASSFLGFTISRDRSRLALTISQPGYARHVVKMAGLENAPTAPSPGEHLRPFTGTSRGAGDPTRMRSLVGLMQYLTNSRCDIICELNKAAKTMSAPTAEDITAAERIIRYINGTLDHGITFSGDGPCQIVGYADASNQSETGGYSRTSIILSLGEGNGAFVAKSYTQTLLGTSTQHSEIQALSDATRYAVYFRNIAAELGLHQEPIPMFEDNRAAESFTKGESEFDRSKHILQQHRYCAEAQGLKFISVLPIDTKLQRADQGTKILPPLEHAFHTALNLNLANRVPVPALAAGQ